MKRFEFVEGDEIVIAPGRTVKRIRALVEMVALGVASGDLGGYIEKESQVYGNAWVYDSAQVSGSAMVYGSARVYGSAQVSGSALVSGSARVYDSARVYGDALVYDSARVYGDALVYDSARVYGDALVYGDAMVYGSALVYGDALVYDSARVYGDALVYGSAQVSGSALVYGKGLICWFANVGSEDGTLTIYNTKDNCIEVTRGCFQGTPEEFLAASAEKHDERIQHEYRLLIEVGISRVTAARAKEEE